MMKSPWKLWRVHVPGFDPGLYTGLDADSVLRSAYNFSLVADNSRTLDEFREVARVIPFEEYPNPDGYEYIRKHYGLDVRIGQLVGTRDGRSGFVTYPGASSAYVLVGAVDGSEWPMRFHPGDVVIETAAQFREIVDSFENEAPAPSS